MIEIAVFYDKFVEKYPEYLFSAIVDEVTKLESRYVKVTFSERKTLSRPQMEKAVDDIRRIKPQSRGSVVASGGKTMPISGSRN